MGAIDTGCNCCCRQLNGGISRGTDVVKALILGADAISVGRLDVYGLAAAGAEGTVQLFEILEDEIRSEQFIV